MLIMVTTEKYGNLVMGCPEEFQLLQQHQNEMQTWAKNSNLFETMLLALRQTQANCLQSI